MMRSGSGISAVKRRSAKSDSSSRARSSVPAATASATARAYAAAVAAGKANLNDDSWETFARHLYSSGLPDPDLIIRTSGEYRVSNFLLLQAAYAEFVFTPVLWPDFTKADLATAVEIYSKRERRFGQTSEQLKPASTS